MEEVKELSPLNEYSTVLNNFKATCKKLKPSINKYFSDKFSEAQKQEERIESLSFQLEPEDTNGPDIIHIKFKDNDNYLDIEHDEDLEDNYISDYPLLKSLIEELFELQSEFFYNMEFYCNITYTLNEEGLIDERKTK